MEIQNAGGDCQEWTGVILLLFARPLLVGIVLPLLVAHCSFRRPPLARLQRAIVGCCLLLSAALFVVARCPAIIDDCVAGCRPPAHLVALVSPAASAFVALWARSSSSSSSSSRAAAGLSVGTKPWWSTSWSSSASSHCRRLGGKARWWPDKAVRRTAHPVMRVVRPPAAAGQSHHPSSSAPPRQPCCWHCWHRRVIASSHRHRHRRWFS